MEEKILGTIRSPEDVKKLNKKELDQLCAEIRATITETVSKNGGHLASNLGAVELTVALHRAFSSPKDAILFDVGHQSYTHKILTGRFDRFSTIRTEGGISGFMRPDESEHDPFVTGHSSNSISAAYGIYRAKRIRGEAGTAVAVIGDGAMTGGMAYEALNNVGSARSNFIIVLNDNKMSISRNVGAMSRAFTYLRNRPRYHYMKFAVDRILLRIPLFGKPLHQGIARVKDYVRSIVYHNNFFVDMGYNYLGPVDGHDIEAMEALFKIAQSYTRPSLIHVVTTKGKGYSYAEHSPKNYHGVSPFDLEHGADCSGKENFSEVAGRTLCRLAQEDERICAITAAMTTGTGLQEFSSRFKNRFFDVGIAEQHAVTFGAGLATGGMKPFFVVYSSFLQRGYDQILHDAAIAHLPLKLLVDRAGIVGEDGESHQGIFDAAYLSTVPGMEIYSPSTYEELEYRIEETAQNDHLCAIRYPRGGAAAKADYNVRENVNRFGFDSKRAVITYGRIYENAKRAVETVGDIDLWKLNKIYPLDANTVLSLLKYEQIDFFEEGVRSGGIAEHLSGLLADNGYKGNYAVHAIENCFVPQATVTSSLKKNGLDTDSMVEILRRNHG